jgi:hypothetical protein
MPALLQLSGGATRERGAVHAPAARLPCLACGGEDERLAGARLADDHRNAVAVPRQPSNHLDVLARHRRAALDRALDRPLRREPDASGSVLDRVLEDPLLERP